MRLDHVQIAMPAGGEEAARGFFGALLGLSEISRPAALAGRGGCWFALGDGQALHLGVEDAFRPARKAHVALVTDDLDGLRARLSGAGCLVADDVALPGQRRFFTQDPFGNRLEIVQPVA